MNDTVHMDVAAYALGALDERESAMFHAHLSRCQLCMIEYHRMTEVTSLLAMLDPADALAGPESPNPQVLDRLVGQVRSTRDRGRYRQVLAAAAAIIVMIAAPVAVFAIRPDLLPARFHQQQDQDVVTALPADGEQVTGLSTTNGMHAKLALESKDWGTRVVMELGGITGPLECELVAVSHDGEKQIVMSWRVPKEGYGVASAPEPLLAAGGAAFTRRQIEGFQIRTIEGRKLLEIEV